MAKNNVKADLTVGTVIVIVGTTGKYVIKAIEGDKLTVDFIRKEGEAPTTMPMPREMLQKMMDAGKWKLESTTTETKAEERPEQEPTAQEPTAKTVKMEQPAKPKVTPKRKQSQPKAEKKTETKAKAKGLTYATYQNKSSKTCAKITGFSEGDAMLERSNAELVHASSTYERDKKGEKHYMLIFGPRYAAAAKEVCQALNDGKTLTDCKAIIDQATEERQQKRDAWKARRAAYQERNANGETSKAETKQGYSDADVAEMLKKIMAGGDIPEDIKRAMAA